MELELKVIPVSFCARLLTEGQRFQVVPLTEAQASRQTHPGVPPSMSTSVRCADRGWPGFHLCDSRMNQSLS